MLTIKNTGGQGAGMNNVQSRRAKVQSLAGTGEHRPSRVFVLLAALVVGFVVGCRPPGPRALQDGQDLVEHGRYAEAIVRLKTATSLLGTNVHVADAWNYLGLAYHQSGQVTEAAEAYKKALAFDQNLVEVHYNLGCLWLEQNHPELAKAELTAYTLHQDKSAEGFTKLGEAQLEMHDLVGADRSLNQARLIAPQNPVVMNDLGVVRLQQNRVTEAAQFFNAALRIKADYAPAILNLAILYQTRLNNRQTALQRYHDYLALTPKPANWEAVDAAARDLEQEASGNPVSRPPAPNPATNAVPAQTPQRPATTATARPPKSEPATQRPITPSQPAEVTQVTPEPVIRGAANTGNGSESVVATNTAANQPDRRGFFSRVFRGSKTNPAPAANASQATLPVAPTPEPKPVSYPRFAYRSMAKPASGDRTSATQAFVDGSRAQQAKQLTEAMAGYRKAIQLDPSYFEAYYNLGVVSVQAGNLQAGLTAYETALVIQPDSHDGRFNFALALKQAGYPIDAASELEKVLAKSPSDVYAHYALANLYAQQLRQPAKAREHYQKVLELNPSFSQAGVIRSWLGANP
jgi:tetratricopeptide (TPR) repeat protein